MTRSVLVGALMVGVACAGALLLFNRGPDADWRGRQSVQPGRLRSPGRSQDSARSTPLAISSARVLTNASENDSAAAAARPATLVPLPEPKPYCRQLVGALCRLDQPTVPQTPEQVAEWKQNLQQLVAQGSPAVAAIREFLQKNVDLDFGPGNGLGYTSARAAMFDALVQIGGADGIAGTLQTLRDTADPREIALLTQNLEKLAPGEHRQEAIEAAREALAMAASGKLEGADVAPLFEVLHSYGNTSVVSDLMQAAKQWNYYSAIALAELPDGAGIPSLIELAKGTSGGKLNALEMLAQMSTQYPEAREALIDQARANKISPNMWPYLTALLAGDLYHYQDSAFDSPVRAVGQRSNSAHVVMGNQYFYTAPAVEVLTTEQINERMALIDELQMVASDPAALKALEQSRELLRSRQPQTVAISP
jgi:hypothetical protein